MVRASAETTPMATPAPSTPAKHAHKQRRRFAAGALGGMTAAVVTSPLEVVKTRLQTRASRALLLREKPLTTMGVMRTIVRNESVFGLWRGLSPTLVGIVPGRAVYFGTYGWVKDGFAAYGYQGAMCNLLSAAAAGAASATLVCPIWVVKTRLQLLPTHTADGVVATPGRPPSKAPPLGLKPARPMSTHSLTSASPRFSSVWRVALQMYREEGPRAFFRGLTASYWGITESALQFMLYEEAKKRIDEPSNFKYFVAAGACKLVASMLTYPHEVVRTRMRDQRAPMGSTELKYRAMFQSIGTIFREEGMRGLYGGMPAHLLRVVPNAAIMFCVVEMVTQHE